MGVTEKILEILPVACYHLDQESRVTYINPYALTLFQLQQPDCIGKNIWEIFPEAKTTPCFAAINAAHNGRQLAGHDYISSVTNRWIRLTAFPADDGIIVYFTDIHALKIAEYADDQFRLLVTASSRMVYRMSADWTKMYNLNGKNILTDLSPTIVNWTDLYLPKGTEKVVWEAVEQAIKTKSILDLEHQVIQPDGSVGWLHSRAVPVLDKDGEIIEWLAAGSDITARKQAEETRRNTEARLAAELSDTQRLQHLSSRIIQEGNVEELYEEIIITAMALMQASSASMQMYLPEKKALLLLVSKGIVKESANYWHWVDVTSHSACGLALTQGKRFVIEDVQTNACMVGTDDLHFYQLSGIRGVQSTPLVSRKGNIVGMISTHWADVHIPSEPEFRLLDVLARQAADLIERKQAEEVIRKSEERLQLALNSANIFTWDVDPETGQTKYSDNFSQVIGFELSDISTENFINIHAEDEPFVMAAVDDAIKRGISLDVEHRVINPQTKGEIWVRAQGRMAQKAAGDYSFIGITQNITERRLAEQVLKDHRAQLELEIADRTSDLKKNYALMQTISDTTLIGMSVFEPVRDMHGTITDFRIMLVNQKIVRTTGRNDMVGKLYGELFPGIKKMGLFELMVKTVESDEPGMMEYNYQHDGIDRWYSTMFVKGENSLVSTNLDITARKLAEQERFRNYVLLQQSEELAEAGSWDYDLLTGAFTWSDGMYRLFDLIHGVELQPEIYLQYATPESMPAAERIVQHLRSGDQNFEDMIEINVGGHLKILRLKASVIKNENGQKVRVLGVDLDITAMRIAERRLRHMEALQQQEIFQVTLNAQEEERRRISESLHNGLGQLLYGTKLNLNYLSLRIAETNPEKFSSSKNYTDELLAEAIKETRRISHELMPMVLAEFGLEAAIKEVCAQLQDGVRFRCRIALNGIVLDNYLELAVFRIVQELMINIAKHAKATLAHVNVLAESTRVKIHVNDNGIGIAADAQHKPGIGLASIRNKVSLLNGKFEIDGSNGKGTSIEVLFPIYQFNET